jgi:hypothetical protein
MPPGSRAWDESHSRPQALLAQAQNFTRFGNGAKKKLAIEVTNPGAMAAEKTHKNKPRQNEDRDWKHAACQRARSESTSELTSFKLLSVGRCPRRRRRENRDTAPAAPGQSLLVETLAL